MIRFTDSELKLLQSAASDRAMELRDAIRWPNVDADALEQTAQSLDAVAERIRDHRKGFMHRMIALLLDFRNQLLITLRT